jgi:hypothetical protein
MKTTESNGTILEIGKKYYLENWTSREWIEIIDISIEEREIWTINDRGVKCSYETGHKYLPYKEPQPKPFEGYQKWYELYENGMIQVCYSIYRPVPAHGKCYSESEILELGLKI